MNNILLGFGMLLHDKNPVSFLKTMPLTTISCWLISGSALRSSNKDTLELALQVKSVSFAVGQGVLQWMGFGSSSFQGPIQMHSQEREVMLHNDVLALSHCCGKEARYLPTFFPSSPWCNDIRRR